MSRVLLDTTVFVYAVGAEHPYREPCRAVLGFAREGRFEPEASVELVHELAYVRARKAPDRVAAAKAASAVKKICLLHPLEPADTDHALTLWVRYPSLDMRDAIFAATALRRDIPTILSADRAFDAVEDLDRVDPADRKSVERLLD